MLYSEFVQGTGCRETDNNYRVYKELELIYMNTDCTKEHIYEMGKKLVDNSKTEEEIAQEEKYKREIENEKERIEACKDFVDYYKGWAEYWKDNGDEGMHKENLRMMKEYKTEIKLRRAYIKEIKGLMGL